MNLEKLKDAARKHEQKEDWRRAIEVYQKAIVEFESGHDPNPDLSIYNRVGDLHMKANNPTAAVQAYERAVDLYSDQGFLNNAIALCGKVLRVNPGRIQAYLKLAQLHARKNVVIEAKKNLIEYLERMNQVHQLDEAFKAVKAFADQFPGNQEIRLMLSDLLRASSRTTEAREQLQKLSEDLEAKGDAAGARKTRERLQAIDELPEAPPQAPRRGDLVFLDIGIEVAPTRPAPPPPPTPPRRSTIRTPRPTVRTTPMIPPEALLDETPVTPAWEEPAGESLEIETSRLADSDIDPAAMVPQEPLADLLGADDAPAPIEGLDGLEPTILESPPESGSPEALSGLEVASDFSPGFDAAESLLEDDLSVVEPVEALEGIEQALDEDVLGEPVDVDGQALAADDGLVLDVVPDDGARISESLEFAEAEIVDVTEPGTLGGALDDGTDWEIPEDLEPLVGQAEAGLPESGLAMDEPVAGEPMMAPVDGSAEASLSFLQVEEPAQPTIEDLEDLILDDPDNPETHRALGEALLASGDTVRGIDELDLALLGYENREDWEHALDLISELIRVEPTSVRYYQKRVEVAYRTGEKGRLIEAYQELGDALVRSGALDKALAVYRRVLEHEPDNARAGSALQALAPPEEVPPAAEAAARPAAGRPSAPAVPRSSAPPAPAGPVGGGDFIDLGSLILEEDEVMDTRMRVEDEEPTGDEERDFKEMLSAFKRGIEQNLDAEDFQSHYDLGVAFKEMGLLDEAIAEFQKALRSPDGRLRTSEALGVCFYEKAQYPIAEAILRRAVDSQPGADDEKVGLLYWLARALEVQGKVDDALATFRRVLAVDIRFADASDRMGQLSAGRA